MLGKPREFVPVLGKEREFVPVKRREEEDGELSFCSALSLPICCFSTSFLANPFFHPAIDYKALCFYIRVPPSHFKRLAWQKDGEFFLAKNLGSED